MSRLPVDNRNLPPDMLAEAAILSGALVVDPVEGSVRHPDGRRAERLHNKTGYGQVRCAVNPDRWAMAHRVVWTAVNGVLPARIEINHANRHPWDNRLENLEAVLPEGNQRHWRGQWYERVPGPEWLAFVAAAREETRQPRLYDPYCYSWLQQIGARGSALHASI